jgi:hypothetical protein
MIADSGDIRSVLRPADDGLSHARLAQVLAALEAGDARTADSLLAAEAGSESGPRRLDDTQWLADLAQARMAAQDWSAALLIQRILQAAGHTGQESLLPWLTWRAEHQPAFHAQFEARAPLDRLKRFLDRRLPHAVTAIRTERMPPGLVAMAIFRHHLRVEGTDEEVVIIEKVLSTEPYDLARIEQEHLLFSAMPAAALMAPDYVGRLVEGRFASNFHGFFPGWPLDIARWVATHSGLLYRYWCIVPPMSVRGGPRIAPIYLDHLARIIAQDVPPQVLPLLDRQPLPAIAARLAERAAAIEEVVRIVPRFVFHDDLHCGNILVNEIGQMAIIDWDNWAVAPIGTGWQFHATEDWIPEIDLDRITWARELPSGIGRDQLMLMAAFWGWHKALRESKWLLAARWLEKIARYA